MVFDLPLHRHFNFHQSLRPNLISPASAELMSIFPESHFIDADECNPWNVGWWAL